MHLSLWIFIINIKRVYFINNKINMKCLVLVKCHNKPATRILSCCAVPCTFAITTSLRLMFWTGPCCRRGIFAMIAVLCSLKHVSMTLEHLCGENRSPPPLECKQRNLDFRTPNALSTTILVFDRASLYFSSWGLLGVKNGISSHSFRG